MANKIQKQKTALIVISVLALVLGLAGVVGGIILVVLNAQGLAAAISNDTSFVSNIIFIVIGVALAILGAGLTAFGVRYLWTGLVLKATKGSVADPSATSGTVNGKRCPKCGCTNTPDQTKCTSCGADLDGQVEETK